MDRSQETEHSTSLQASSIQGEAWEIEENWDGMKKNGMESSHGEYVL